MQYVYIFLHPYTHTYTHTYIYICIYIYAYEIGLLQVCVELSSYDLIRLRRFKDFKFVPLMFVPLGFGSQIPLLRAIFHGLRTQTPGYKP